MILVNRCEETCGEIFHPSSNYCRSRRGNGLTSGRLLDATFIAFYFPQYQHGALYNKAAYALIDWLAA